MSYSPHRCFKPNGWLHGAACAVADARSESLASIGYSCPTLSDPHQIRDQVCDWQNTLMTQPFIVTKLPDTVIVPL